MYDQLHHKISTYSGDVGISFQNLSTDEAFGYHQDDVFLAASTFKIPILYELYRQEMVGDISLDQKVTVDETNRVFGSGVLQLLDTGHVLTLKELATLMMTLSDNTATDLVLSEVGRENVNASCQSLGLNKTRLRYNCRELLLDAIGIKPDDAPAVIHKKLLNPSLDEASEAYSNYRFNNLTSPADMLSLFKKIYRHEVLDPTRCNEMLEIMKRCQTNWRIPRYLKQGQVVAHKTGTLGGIANDCGIIYTPVGDYILSVYVKAPYRGFTMPCDAFDLIADISLLFYQHVTGKKVDYVSI